MAVCIYQQAQIQQVELLLFHRKHRTKIVLSMLHAGDQAEKVAAEHIGFLSAIGVVLVVQVAEKYFLQFASKTMTISE